MGKKRKIIYITGISGTGKTTLAKEFLERGNCTIDLDKFSHWEHKESREINHWFPGASRDFLENHEWVCNLDALKKFFKEHKNENIFVFGIVDKEKEAFLLFDIIILLQISIETAFRRVDLRNDNVFGKGNTEKEWIKSWKNDFEKDLIAKGATPVSAEDKINVVVKNIVDICKI